MRKQRSDGMRFTGVIMQQLLAVLAAFGVIFLLLCVFAFITAHMDAGDSVFAGMSTAALFVGAYAGGYVCGRRRKRCGFMMGAVTGLLVFIIVLVLGSIFLGTAESVSHTGKLFLTVAAAAVGGAAGVNHKKNV